MTPKEFIDKYYPFALKIQQETEIPAIAIIAQAAFESGWGKKTIGNNFFGVKYNPKVDSKFTEALTPEYFTNRSDFENKGWKIVNVEYHLDVNKFRVILYAKFADYDTPYEGFLAHSKLLLTKRYAHALKYKDNAKEYLKAIAESGYATEPTYAKLMSDMVDSIIKRL